MRLPTLLLLLSLPWLSSTAAAANPTDPATSESPAATQLTPLPPPVDTFTVGSLQVQRYGDEGRALILIPGLGSGAWVWSDTIAHFSDDHVVYALTLAGFNGVPAPERDGGLIDLAEASLLELIGEHDIEQPVLIGHSLGGTLALGFASEHSDLISAVVAVDGLPVFPGTEQLGPEQRQARARMLREQMAGMSPEQFEAQQLGFMQHTGVIDPGLAATTAALQAKSDPLAVARYMAEDIALDLRPQLAGIDVPVLEISPYHAADFKRAAAAGRMPMMSVAQKADYYRSLLDGVAELEVVSIAPARHFVMLDRPQAFLDALDAFLERL